MDLAMGAMGSLLPKLGELLNGEYQLQKGMKQDIEFLERELQRMHAALSKMAEVPRGRLDEQDRLWASDVRELSQDIEDVVESFLLRIVGSDSEPTTNPECFKGMVVNMVSLFKKGWVRRKIATTIKGIKDQIHEVANRDDRYRGHGVAADPGVVARTPTNVDPRLLALYEDHEKIIGIDYPRDMIIKKLTEGDYESSRQLRILSVVGFGGLGKTTLTKAVYDRLRGDFSCGAFVPVSQNPDMKKVLRDLIFELDSQKYSSLSGATLTDQTQLIKVLRELLLDAEKTMSYIIVIDDLWDVKAWEVIRYALVDNNRGSRIITTTRNLDVSKACCSSNDDMIYNMKPLSDDDSRFLFHKRIFLEEKECPHELEQVSRDILKKCGGVPMAIITIGSYLAGDQQVKSKDQWEALLNSIGRGLTKGGGVEEMKRILLLSYYDLPSHLKICLLYLSVYPEDSTIGKGELIRRWIAEGFVQGENHEISLSEIGESWFNTLINRSMIQPINFNIEGRAGACRVHDIMLDLICELSSEENFVTVLDVIDGKTALRRKVRRISLQKGMEKRTATRLSSTSMSNVRSFTIFSPAANQMICLSRFRVLRVLELEGCHLGQSRHLNLRHLGKLLHLRYLGLCGTFAPELPMEIGKLQFLQTLDLGLISANLPSSVVWLRHLIFLNVSSCMELPIGLRNLVSLEVLTGVSMVTYCVDVAKELGHLTNLRVLDICWGSSKTRKEDQALVESLSNLRKLQSLEIRGNGELVYLSQYWVPPSQLRTLVLRGWLQTLPAWFTSSSLPLLSYLHINVREVWLEDIEILGMMPTLRFVCLKASVDPNTEQCDVEKFVLSADAFPSARQCVFYNVALVPCNFPRGAMPKVQSLRFGARVLDIIRGGFDWSMRNLPSLEEVYIDYDGNRPSYHERKESQRMLMSAMKKHPNSPTLHTGYHLEGVGTASGGESSMRPRRPLAGGDGVRVDSIEQASISPVASNHSSMPPLEQAEGDVVGDDLTVQPSISPVASNGFSPMFWSFLVETKLEMKLILSTRIFWCFLIGSVLFYNVFYFCLRQFNNN